MTAAATPQPASDSEVREYLKVWTEGTSQVLTQIAGAPFEMEPLLSAPADAPAPQEQDMQVTVVAAGAVRGEMSLRVPAMAVLASGQLCLQEPQDEASEIKPDHRGAVEELLRQVAGRVATALSPRWGETQLRVEVATSLSSWSAGARGWLVSATGVPRRLLLEWQLSSALVAALRATPEKPLIAESSQPGALAADKLDLLMDVELYVTLRFGKRNMLLRDIMELDAGSVVELDRHVQEHADLFLDGRLIARGEVVVVDGNYGLRVLDIVSSPSAPGRQQT